MKRLFQREMNVPTTTSKDKTADFEVLVRNRQDSDEKTTQKPKTLPRKQVSEIAQSIIDAIVADPKITRRALAAQLGFPEIPSFQLAIFTNSRCFRRSTVPQQPLVGRNHLDLTGVC